MVIWIIGISGSGKTSLGKCLYKILKKRIKNLVFIDGDIFRNLMGNEIGYSLKERDKNAKRLINFVNFINSQKINVICSANLTSSKNRILVRKKIKNYYEVFLKVPIEILIRNRDYKGLYKKAIKGKIKNVVGIDIRKSVPKNSHLIIKNEERLMNFDKMSQSVISKSKILIKKF